MKYLLTIILSIISMTSIASGLSTTDMAQWEKTKIDVASIQGIGGKFYRSLRNFKRNSSKYDAEYEFIKGDLNYDVSGMLIIHILGDLNSKITLDDQSELVIMGDVSKDSVIYIDGMSSIFIGGSVYGSIISRGSAGIYIKGLVKGLITTGLPSAEIEINGDLLGEIKPNDKKGGLVALTVYGFSDIKTIRDIFSYYYSSLNAAFHYSNFKPGIYSYPMPNNKYYTIINRDQ